MKTKWNTDNIKRCVKKYGTLEVIESNFLEEDNYTTYYVSLDKFIEWSNS